jgi:protein-tyrosine-phosphatase
MNDSTGTVLFTCAHGAARSRIAAAYFNAHPPTGWHAITAAAERPNQHLNPAVAQLLADTEAAAHLDQGPPRPLTAAEPADIVIAIDCDGPPGAIRWHVQIDEIDEPLRDELRQRIHALIDTFPPITPPTDPSAAR